VRVFYFYDIIIIRLLNKLFMSGGHGSGSQLRHLVAFLSTLVAALAYYSGYVSGEHGWWWTAFSLAIVYGGVYKIIDA
jgi:hypothetical protein